MIAVRIGPDVRFAVVGAKSYFARRSPPLTPHELVGHNCIGLRLPTSGGLYGWEFEKDGREVRVRVEGQLVFNGVLPIVDAALAGLGLGHVPEDLAGPYLSNGDLVRVLDDWCAPWSGYQSTIRAGGNPRRPSPCWSTPSATGTPGTMSPRLDFPAANRMSGVPARVCKGTARAVDGGLNPRIFGGGSILG